MTSQQTLPVAEAKQKKQKPQNVILLVLMGAVFGAAGGYGIGRVLKVHGGAHKISWWVLLFLPIAFLLCIALHEAGHVVGGLISGFRFNLWVAGPLRIERRGERICFLFNRVAALWGGIASCTPQTFGPELRRQMLLFTAGGPFFSLLGSCVLLPAFMLANSHADASVLLMLSGLINATIATATLIPMNLQGFTSDGARLLMLLRSRPEGARWTAMAAVAGLAMVERPRNWPAELMDLLGDGLDATTDGVNVCLLRHLWEMDRREWAMAELWLERGLRNVGAMAKSTQGGIYFSAAHFYARHSNDSAQARTYLELAQKPGLYNPDDMHATVAAVLIAEGRREEAAAELDLATVALKTKPTGIAEAMSEEIAELRAAALLNH